MLKCKILLFFLLRGTTASKSQDWLKWLLPDGSTGGLVASKHLSLNLNFSFLNRIRYFSYQVATQLSSWGWVDPVPDPILLEKFLGYSQESNPGPLGWQSDVLTTIPNRWSKCKITPYLILLCYMNLVRVCSNANPLHYYVLWVLRKADRWHWVLSIFNSRTAWADHITCGKSICIVYCRKLRLGWLYV